MVPCVRRERRPDERRRVAADATGVYVGGSLWGRFRGEHRVGRQDAFVRKYDLEGNVVWTRQFGTHRLDATTDVALGSDGLYVLGTTNGPLAGPGAGLDDVFVRRYSLDGEVRWTRQFGTDATDACVRARRRRDRRDRRRPHGGHVPVAVVADERVRGLHRSVPPGRRRRWNRRIDGPGHDTVNGLATGGAGAVTVVGSSPGIAGERLFGSDAMFVRRYGPRGAVWWTRTFGSTAFGDRALGVATDAGGTYVVGSTYGDLPGTDQPRTDRRVRGGARRRWLPRMGRRVRERRQGRTVRRRRASGGARRRRDTGHGPRAEPRGRGCGAARVRGHAQPADRTPWPHVRPGATCCERAAARGDRSS